MEDQRAAAIEGSKSGERRFRTAITLIVLAFFVLVVWSGRHFVRPPLPRTIVFYGFSTVEEAMRDGVFPAFQERWHGETGERLEFVATFAGSGTITGEILNRVPAEVAILSSKLDARRLRGVGVSGSARQELPHHGILSRSPIVLVVRPGNPQGIRDFEDLARSGVAVVHADPTTSGAAQWSILAAYGSAFLATGDRERAEELLLGIWKNVVASPPDARAARQKFEDGTGDALISYEQDVVAAPGRPAVAGEIVYPRRTVQSEQTVVKVFKHIADDQRDLVDAFVAFLWSPEAQAILAEHGFRGSVDPPSPDDPRFGAVEELFTLDTLGGAVAVEREILEGVWRQRVVPQLEAAAGR